MNTPVGPSMQVALFLAGAATDLSLHVLTAAWKRWCSVERFDMRLQRLVREELLHAVTREPGVEAVLRLTEAGRLAALGGADPEARWSRSWDGSWRVVLFDVPEKLRARRITLARRLRRARFGYLQDSVWISPDPVEHLERELQGSKIDSATLSILEARPCSGMSDTEMVTGAWDFHRINALYAQHMQILRAAPTLAATGKARHAWLTVEWNAWRRALQADPLLPAALTPAGYRGRASWEARREKLQRLLTT